MQEITKEHPDGFDGRKDASSAFILHWNNLPSIIGPIASALKSMAAGADEASENDAMDAEARIVYVKEGAKLSEAIGRLDRAVREINEAKEIFVAEFGPQFDDCYWVWMEDHIVESNFPKALPLS